MQIVLYQPQIPQNTGNIVRTCSVTGNDLRLIEPLGFSITDRWLKRSGLDYWEGVDVQVLDNLENYLEKTTHPFYFFSSKATRPYSSLIFTPHDILIFGSETDGFSNSNFFQRWPDRFAQIPMLPGARCLNLATSVGIVVYEASRQNEFKFQSR